jgi:hypothetical protein
MSEKAMLQLSLSQLVGQCFENDAGVNHAKAPFLSFAMISFSPPDWKNSWQFQQKNKNKTKKKYQILPRSLSPWTQITVCLSEIEIECHSFKLSSRDNLSLSLSFCLIDGDWIVFHLIFSIIPTFKRVVGYQHHIYKHGEVEEILEYFTSKPLERGVITKIARDTGIPDSILHHWHRQRAIGPTWFPLTIGYPQTGALDADADLVRDNSIDTGIGVTRRALRQLCLNSEAEQAEDEGHLERFCASSTFLRDLERRQ